MKMCKRLQESEREVKGMSFGSNIDNLNQKYLDIFEGVKSDVACTVQYVENSRIWTNYLRMSKIKRQDELKAEHKIPITERLLYARQIARWY